MSICQEQGHDLNADASECKRCGLKSGEHFRILKFPVIFKAGAMVCPLDKSDEELGGYRRERQIKRPLVMGEKVCVIGIMGEFRSGTVITLDPPTVDDGGMYWWPEFDKDDDHGWTVCAFADKRMIDAQGSNLQTRHESHLARVANDPACPICAYGVKS